MRDEAEWDGDEERIADLQALLMPLREPSAPWGEVLARARVATTASPRRARYVAISAAIAATLVLGWAWARGGIEPTPEQTRVDASSVDVATPAAIPELPEPQRTVVEVPPAPSTATPPAAATKPTAEGSRDDRDVKRAPQRRAPSRGRVRDPAADHEILTLESIIELGPRRPSGAVCDRDPGRAGCDEELPDSLSTDEISKTLMQFEGPARACGERHGETGIRIVVKLSVAGDTGRVTSSNATPPFDDSAVGRCVAEAVARAAFPRFRRPKLAVMYPFEL